MVLARSSLSQQIDPRSTRVFRLLADKSSRPQWLTSDPPRHLLASYNVAVTLISKTYVRSGILDATRDLLFLDPSQSSFPERATVAPGDNRDREHLMLDIIMVALGLGFFLAAIGYAHACERL
jgi:hypothetical protein